MNSSIGKAGDELRQLVASAQLAGKSLIQHGNKAAEDRLNQIDNIQKSAFKNADQLLKQSEASALNVIREAIKEVTALERKIMSDMRKLMWEAECGGRRILVQDAADFMGEFGEFIGLNRIRVTMPTDADDTFFCGWRNSCGTMVFDIKTPMGNTFIDIRDAIESNLNRGLKDDNTAYAIIGSYEYLSAFALKTTCFYPQNETSYLDEFSLYKSKAETWKNVFRVRPAN